jgi:hypothetical protein
MKNEKSRV